MQTLSVLRAGTVDWGIRTVATWPQGCLQALSVRRAVTVEELMEESGLSRKAIEDAVRISGGKIESISEK